MDPQPRVTRYYPARSEEKARRQFAAQAPELGALGYEAIEVTWAPGRRASLTAGHSRSALALVPAAVLWIVFPPEGVLTVIYQRKTAG